MLKKKKKALGDSRDITVRVKAGEDNGSEEVLRASLTPSK